jgi:hypothetical protein
VELTVFGATDMAGHNLHHLLASSPALGTLALVLSRTCERVHLRSPSLKCVLLWNCFTEGEVVVGMDSPLLEHLILWKTVSVEDNAVAVRVKIDAAPKLRVLGYLDPRVHQLQIGENVIKVLLFSASEVSGFSNDIPYTRPHFEMIEGSWYPNYVLHIVRYCMCK